MTLLGIFGAMVVAMLMFVGCRRDAVQIREMRLRVFYLITLGIPTLATGLMWVTKALIISWGWWR